LNSVGDGSVSLA